MKKRSEKYVPFLSFSLTLVVRGENLDLDWLSTYLGINPTQTYKSTGAANEEKLDAWNYRLTADHVSQLNTVSNEFFETTKEVGRRLTDKDTIQAQIILHVHAELAQVYFDIPQNMIIELAQCGIPFGISIFDGGGNRKMNLSERNGVT